MSGQKSKICFCRCRSGFALILVLVVLVVLTAIVYRISFSVSRWKHRQQYIIDYQTARYACESGLKYALVAISSVEPNYISRPNEPDFSDLFNMSDKEYKQMMQNWAEKLGAEIDANQLSKSDFTTDFMDFRSLFETNDVNSSRETDFNNPLADFNSFFEPNDINSVAGQEPSLVVSGPYGPPWPYITKPAEIEFGDARVTIEFIDENAKLPLCWGICTDPNMKSAAKTAVVTFCEWMRMEPNQIEPLMVQLGAVKEIKPFSMNLKPVVTVSTQQSQSQPAAQTGRRGRRARARRTVTTVVQETRPGVGHTRDFAKLMHSPMIDLEKLAKPVNEDENRSESALKYISLWGTTQVNINTAPRQVLEAAFTFGGDAPEIAEQIIKQRKIEPFKDIDDLKRKIFRYSDSIEKARPYITAQSNTYTIRVKAISGVAKVCATAGVKKEENGFQKIGIIVE